MNYRWPLVLVLGMFFLGIASSQTVRQDLQNYLGLSDSQVGSINSLNAGFNKYASAQSSQYGELQSQARAELAKDSPDPRAVGSLYGQMAMLGRDYDAQLAKVQSDVAAVLTADQVVLTGRLLDTIRLQPLVSEAACISMESRVVPTFASLNGSFSATGIYVANLSFSPYRSCSTPPLPTALVNYLQLTDGQTSLILNALKGNQDAMDRQSAKITELQYEIQDLTAAQTIDTAKLGADYVAIAQIQRDENTQSAQLVTTVRSVLTDAQQPQLKALDNAMVTYFSASEAVSVNILVLPPDLRALIFPVRASQLMSPVPLVPYN